MEHLSTSEFRLEIRELNDSTSESGRAWVVDVLNSRGEVLIESAGVSSGLPFAIAEAGQEIAHYLADEWNMQESSL